MANWLSLVYKKKPYRTLTHSHSEYLNLFRDIGLARVRTYYPSPNYKYIDQIYSASWRHQHPYKAGQTFKTSLVNDIRNFLFSVSFLVKFANAFSLIAGREEYPSLLEKIIKRHFKESSVYSYEVNQEEQRVEVKFISSSRYYQLDLPLAERVEMKKSPISVITRPGLLLYHDIYANQEYFIYQIKLINQRGLGMCGNSRLYIADKFRGLFIHNLLVKWRKGLVSGLIHLLLIMERVVQKDKNLVLFGAMNGNFYGDNSRHLFEWMLIHRPQINYVWITASRRVEKELNGLDYPVVRYNNLRGLYFLFKASLCCYTNSVRDIIFEANYLPAGIKMLALRHGRSVKRVRFARLEHKIDKTEEESRKIESERIIAAISTSEFVSKIQEECLGIGKEKHIVTGYPRTDRLIKPTKEDKRTYQRLLEKRSGFTDVLYAPSWRHGRYPTTFFPFKDFDLNKLNEYLTENRVRIWLRPHVNDLLKYPELNQFLKLLSDSNPLIRILDHNKVADVNQILPGIDMLISDYSALYHDYLLLDRPIILIPYDYDDFARQNGFLYDYKKYAPGPLVYSQEGLVRQLLTSKDKFKHKRAVLRKLIYRYQDTNACERVANIIESQIGRDL